MHVLVKVQVAADGKYVNLKEIYVKAGVDFGLFPFSDK